MNYFELVIAVLFTACAGTTLLHSMVIESPMKAMSVAFSLLMFGLGLLATCLVWKELKKQRNTEDVG
jgi:cytochrome c biogenesis protein CcdA